MKYISAQIDIFFEYFSTKLSACLKLTNRLHKKILMVVILDALARSIYPKRNNHDRFVGLISNFTDWPDHKRVSLYQMFLMLRTKTGHDSKLAKEIGARLGRWGEGKIYRPNIDPFIDEALSFATNKEKNIVKKSQYSELLYIYRNHLIHEFREPGRGFEFDQRDKTPFYHTMDKLGNKTVRSTSWELVFPVGFFKERVQNCLKNLKIYFESKELNPYDSYEFGTMWRSNKR